MAKAFGGGADFVMCGVFQDIKKIREKHEENGEKFKLFYGMSSQRNGKHYGEMANYRSSEGRCIKVKYKGPLENTVLII